MWFKWSTKYTISPPNYFCTLLRSSFSLADSSLQFKIKKYLVTNSFTFLLLGQFYSLSLKFSLSRIEWMNQLEGHKYTISPLFTMPWWPPSLSSDKLAKLFPAITQALHSTCKGNSLSFCLAKSSLTETLPFRTLSWWYPNPN